MSVVSWLTSPWATLAGLAGGVAIGGLWPAAGPAMAPFGDLYLALMQMCVLPIIVTAISTSIARLLVGQSAAALPRLALVFLFGMVIAAGLALALGLLLHPGSGLEHDQRVFLAQEMLRQEAQTGTELAPNLWGLAQMIVPTNIVRAAADGHILALLLFSLLLGLGLGKLGPGQGEQAIAVLDAFYNALLKVMGWIQVGLPLGLLALMAAHTAQGGSDTVLALGKLIATLYGLVLVLMAILTLIISRRTGLAPLSVLNRVRRALFTAFGTSSSVASLPAALNAVDHGLGLGRQTAQMVLPLGVSLYPLGNVIHVVISSVFVLQLYGLPLGLQACAVIVLGGILVACAMTGAPGIASMTLLAVLLTPFGVPVELAIVLLVALEPILDPPLTLLNVFGNITAAAIMAPQPIEPSPLSIDTDHPNIAP